KNGIVRHYHKSVLAASLPAATTEIMMGVLAGDAVGLLASDATFVMARASASQYTEDAPPCEKASYGADSVATMYSCPDGIHALLGRRVLGVLPPDASQLFVSYDPASQRAALSSESLTAVYDPDGKQREKTASHYGPLA